MTTDYVAQVIAWVILLGMPAWLVGASFKTRPKRTHNGDGHEGQ